MKLKYVLFFVFFGTIIISCKKHNDEDPWYPHFQHLNDRLEGEWELVALKVKEQVLSDYSKDDVFENYSYFLDIDTTNIAKFFKFVPTAKQSKVEGRGDLFVKTKSMKEYPEQIGICLSLLLDLSDTNVALAKLKYEFREGSNKNYFRISFDEIVPVANLAPEIPTFKPVDGYFVFNNFYIKSYVDFLIKKATKKELILYYGVPLDQGLGANGKYRRYRLTFKKTT